MRALLPFLALLAVPLGNALAAHDWLVAFPLAVVIAGGIVLMACDATPGAVASPAPADATTDSASATEGGR